MMPVVHRRAWRIVVAIVAALSLSACGLLGSLDAQADLEMMIAWENHTDQPYTLRVDEALGGSAARLGPCESGVMSGVVSVPFSYSLGPGGIEETEGQPLAPLFTSAAMPQLGEAGLRIVLDGDGNVTILPNNDQQPAVRALC